MSIAANPDTILGSLTKRAEFLFVKDGLYQAQPHLVIQMRKNPNHNICRIGFTATKRIGNAVIRNRAKRRMRHIARALIPIYGQKGHDYVFIARNDTAQANWNALTQQASKALQRLAKQANKKYGKAPDRI